MITDTEQPTFERHKLFEQDIRMVREHVDMFDMARVAVDDASLAIQLHEPTRTQSRVGWLTSRFRRYVLAIWPLRGRRREHALDSYTVAKLVRAATLHRRAYFLASTALRAHFGVDWDYTGVDVPTRRIALLSQRADPALIRALLEVSAKLYIVRPLLLQLPPGPQPLAFVPPPIERTVERFTGRVDKFDQGVAYVSLTDRRGQASFGQLDADVLFGRGIGVDDLFVCEVKRRGGETVLSMNKLLRRSLTSAENASLSAELDKILPDNLLSDE